MSNSHWEYVNDFGSWAQSSLSVYPWLILRQSKSDTHAEDGRDFIAPHWCAMNDNQKWMWCCLAENQASLVNRTRIFQMISVIRWVVMGLGDGVLSLTNFMEVFKRVWIRSTPLNFPRQFRSHETQWSRFRRLGSTSCQLCFYCNLFLKPTNSSFTYYVLPS